MKLVSNFHKIMSGGQTGADRGGLDAAIELDLWHGGYCPKGRRAEDGVIPSKYLMVEMESSDWGPRTRRNVEVTHATMIFARGPLTGGSLLTRKIADELGKPFLTVDLLSPPDRVRSLVSLWLTEGFRTKFLPSALVLNVAGSRESKAPGIGDEVRRVLVDVLSSETK